MGSGCRSRASRASPVLARPPASGSRVGRPPSNPRCAASRLRTRHPSPMRRRWAPTTKPSTCMFKTLHKSFSGGDMGEGLWRKGGREVAWCQGNADCLGFKLEKSQFQALQKCPEGDSQGCFYIETGKDIMVYDKNGKYTPSEGVAGLPCPSTTGRAPNLAKKRRV